MQRLFILIGLIFILQGCMVMNVGEDETMQERLFEAVEEKEFDKVKELLDNGVDINAQDPQGRTGIMIATYANDVEMVKLLIDAGADVDIQDDMLNNPFLYAGAEGYMDILKLMISAGADPTITNRYGGVALIPASEHGYVEVVEELLTNTKTDVNHVNNLGWTALLEAIILNDGSEKQQQTVRLLIEHGANVNLADKDSVTPLAHAREKGFKEIEAILLEAGAK
ncbi:ankyrin repeat domain-containing protein [Psychrobacillus sp. INOP01]|nr:ankyrin repeat domain-containing protein [Psychrobacillus sp. INOP01]